MLTAIVSDLHLGTTVAGADVARRPDVRARLLEALAGADQLVLLGDVLELREQPLLAALEAARPVLEGIGELAAARRVVLVPGNHDHQLAGPWLARARLDARGLGNENEWPVRPGDGVAARLAEWMPDAELVVAYPGVRLRPDVYVTHGHYLDVRLTVPRLESLAASLMARVTGRGRRCNSAEDYEAVLEPLYALLYTLAQGSAPPAARSSGQLSRRVWRALQADGAGRLPAFLLGRVTIPGAVAVLNRTGFGPFRPALSGAELRRAGVRAMAEVVEGMGVEADHVIFGHTHRPGPLPGDDPAEWALPSGGRLWNSGSWLYEGVFVDDDPHHPYWPGTVLYLEDSGPPRIENLLRDVPLPGTPSAGASSR